MNFQRKIVYQSYNELVFGTYFEYMDQEYLVLVDTDLNLMIFNGSELRKKDKVERPAYQTNLFSMQ